MDCCPECCQVIQCFEALVSAVKFSGLRSFYCVFTDLCGFSGNMDKITVLCPNGHRVTITTSRNTTLSEILDEVCKKKSFDARGHVLQHHSKNVDLALSVHLANLPRNSHLEMVAAEAPAPGILSLRWFSIYKDR